MKGQTKEQSTFLKNSTSFSQSKHGIKSLSLKSYLMARKEYKKSSTNRYTPNFSVDLLEGKGIHLFNISEMGPIPSMRIGARIKAGITITI